jgi:predicted phage terminase large subunit-like protein
MEPGARQSLESKLSTASLASFRAERVRRSLAEFIRTAWPIVESAPFVPGWHIDAIAEHLTAVTSGAIRDLLLLCPPRHTKSLLVGVFWPCWEWITHPERRWLCASYAEALAVRDNVRARRLMQSAWYQQSWGHVFQFAGDQNQKHRQENNRGGHRIAIGTGGSATGEGGDRLVIDDPHNLIDVESTITRQGTLDWFDTVWSTRRNDPQRSARVIILQRSHCDDLAGHVLEQGGWECLALPTEYEGDRRRTSIGWTDPRTREGELLWPQRFGNEAVSEAKRALGSFAFSAQHQQHPVPLAGGIWKRDWFRFYRRADRPARFDLTVTSWDCTFKDARTSDFVAGQWWGRKGADFYLLSQVHARLDFPATLAAIRNLNESAAPSATLVEDKANGPAVIATLQREIPGLIAINPEGGKESRAAAVAPLFEAGNVFLPVAEEEPWIDDALLEFCQFPSAKHDDRVDAASQALLWMRKRAARGLSREMGALFARANGELSSRNSSGGAGAGGYAGDPESAPSVREQRFQENAGRPERTQRPITSAFSDDLTLSSLGIENHWRRQ